MKQSWGFLIPKYYNYGFENFYATVIQRAYRNYKKRPESLAKRIWEAVRNDGTPNRKKFLGILGYYQKVKNPETQEEYVIACEEFYAYFRKYYSKYIGIINPVKLTPPHMRSIFIVLLVDGQKLKNISQSDDWIRQHMEVFISQEDLCLNCYLLLIIII